MKKLQLTQEPVVKAEMLIRRPVAEVFEAFVNPEITTNSGLPKATEDWKPVNRLSGIGN